MQETIVATFYRFTALQDYRALREPFSRLCADLEIKGTILLASEGINATVAGSRRAIDALLGYLRADIRLADLRARESVHPSQPFRRMKVRLKRELISMGWPEADPRRSAGHRVPPGAWNALISDPDVLLVDTRNDYEVAIGSFQGALNPATERFRDFPDYVHRHLDPARHTKVAMFCTGGIRCEKASAHLLDQGFQEVYQLEGGILAYLESIPEAQSLWNGECFVFDDRVALSHGLRQGRHELCLGCGRPLSAEATASADFEAGVSCPHCAGELSPERRQRLRQRRRTAAAPDPATNRNSQ